MTRVYAALRALSARDISGRMPTGLYVAIVMHLALCGGRLAAQCTGSSCPLCFNNLPPAPGHGRQGNYTKINVCVDSSWSSSASRPCRMP